MPTSDPIEVLLAHNRWATKNLLQACARLPADQFRQRFEIGPGSLYNGLLHILAAMRGWGDLLAGRDQRPRLESDDLSVDEMTALLDELSDDLEASARAHPPGETVTGLRGGRSFTFTRGAVLSHVVTHGMHHRAQCLNMLRRLGADPLPASAVVEWMLTADSQE